MTNIEQGMAKVEVKKRFVHFEILNSFVRYSEFFRGRDACTTLLSGDKFLISAFSAVKFLEPALGSPADEICGGMDIQLSHQIRSMVIDRLRADE